MKIRKGVMLLMLLPAWVMAQQHLPDSTVRALKLASNDSSRYALNHNAALYFQEINKDSSLFYNEKCLSLAENNNLKLTTARVLANKGYLLIGKAKYAEALNSLLQAFAIAENPQNASKRWFTNQKLTPEQSRLFVLALTHHMYGILMKATKNATQEVFHFKEARRIALLIPDKTRVMLAAMNLGEVYQILNRTDSALVFLNEAKKLALETGQKGYFSVILADFGDIALKKGDKAKAKSLYYEGISSATATNNNVAATRLYTILATLYLAEKNRDSSLYFAQKMLQTSVTLGMRSSVTANIGIAYEKLYESYKLRGQLDSAYKYSRLALAENDSINNTRVENLARFQSLSLKEQLRLKNLEKQKVLYQSHVRIYALLAGLFFFIAIGIILWRNNRKQKRTNQLLSEQKEEISAQRDNLEHQNHELEIEAALERVRSRTMAMQRSEELSEVVFVLFQQFKELGENPDQATIGIFNDTERVIEYWVTMHGDQNNKLYKFSIDEPNVTHKIYEAWKAHKSSLVIDLSGKPLFDFMEYRASKGGAAVNPDEKRRIINVALFSKGLINVQSTIERSEESIRLLERFARVFEQTYTRFLDLQKAEAQAREGQIQLALERVRARTMAMHKSAELTEVAGLLFKQVNDLGIKTWTTGFNVWSDDNNSFVDYITSPQGGFIEPYTVYAPETKLAKEVSDARKNGDEFLVQYAGGEVLKETYLALTKLAKNKQYEKMLEGGFQFPSKQVDHFVFGSKVSLMFITYEPVPEAHDIFKRFGKVFEQTYTRFLDLQKAEAQVREAQIEAALERVRSRTMAMHSSRDVADTSVTMFQELVKLGVESTVRCGVAIISSVNDLEVWTASLKDDGCITLDIGRLAMTAHPLLMQVFSAWQNNESSTTYELTGDAVRSYFQALNDAPGYPFKYQMDSLPEKWGINAFFFAEGCLFAFTGEPLSLEMSQVFKRFAAVFGQTYTRFLDLQRAEAQAREAQIEAALERVRSRTLAMQKSDELAGTAAVLFRQMISLGIEPNRLYIGITQEENTAIEFWITDEDGSKVSNMFTGDASKNRSMEKMRDAWKTHQESIVIDMHGQELSDYFQYLGEILHVPFKDGLAQNRRIQYISFFSNGFIGMASPDDQPQETVDLLDRFAYVFHLTFARFNDLKIAEKHAIQAEQDLLEIKAAKQRAEDALTDLRAAQKQLVQSEKMASLGELTAGIAHEIQNPLNFVNNFSEVSAEMIAEMTEELDKGDIEEVKAIAGDIKENLEKIRHHGKRADGIVKGMLQHSRTSSGQKEPTDLNVLADEYLRLSYHGLRAKDKSFNADLVTHFDKGLPKITVIPQDMGRVILNLINNAFYATQQRKKTAEPDYKPTVEVKTQVSNGQALISVKDNGIGIPESIKDKILQPFFTTKPTGEGTGLGLSLTYDIVVKGHGGNILINSTEGNGSEFIINLPLKS